MSHPSKVKGSSYEREIVDAFRAAGIEAERAWGSNGRALGQDEEVDVLIAKKRTLQAKRRKALPTWIVTLLQDHVDFVAMREDRGTSYVMMRLDTLITLLSGGSSSEARDTGEEPRHSQTVQGTSQGGAGS